MRRTSVRSTLIGTVTILILTLAVISRPWPVEAHFPGVSLSAFGTATVDGTLSPGEWDNAARIDFDANVPSADGGGTTPATLFVMNDGTNLYLALKIARTSFGGTTNPIFLFDNNHNGVLEVGDDLFGMNVGIFGPVEFGDGFWFTCPGDPPGTAACSASDTDFGGTLDGATAATNDGSFTIIELSHPLKSGDTSHDFSLAPGDTVGFQLLLQLFNLTLPFDSAADTVFPPACVTCAELFGDIVIASPVIPVAIDIEPGTFPNSINPGKKGVIPVAILGTDTFDATTVDPSTVRFGKTGIEAAPVHSAVQDVNGDGKLDMIFQFSTQSTGIVCGGTSASLTGKTLGDQAIMGADSIRTVNCR